jgi:hypothetical protein
METPPAAEPRAGVESWPAAERSADGALHILAPRERPASGTDTDPADAQTTALTQALGLARELAESRRQEAEGLRAQLRQLERLVERQENLIALQTEQLAALHARLDRILERRQPPAPNAPPWALWAVLALGLVTLLLATSLILVIRRGPRGKR